MADHDTPTGSTALTLHEAEAVPHVPHHMPFVAQLIANAGDIASPQHRRRKSDRTGPLRAYAALGLAPQGDTRRIV